VNASDVCEFDIACPGADSRLGRDEFQGALDLLAEDAGRLRAMYVPPHSRFCDLICQGLLGWGTRFMMQVLPQRNEFGKMKRKYLNPCSTGR
jgi:hypothetical protein